MRFAVRVLAVVPLSLIMIAAVSAQEQKDPGETARFQWGPLRFTPGIAISDVGVDNNVFNDVENPKSDTTAAIGPAINLWTNVGPLRLSEKSAAQYLYFKEFDNQRSWNTMNDLRIELPLSRIKPFAAAGYANTRQRPGFEIDSRARATVNGVTLGSEIRMSGKTAIVLSGMRSTTAFDQHETFLGSELANSLNRHSDSELAEFRYRVTPLTTFVVMTDAVQDRFDFEKFRNTDSFSVRPGFEFKPFALIAGKVSVGFRHFNVLNDAIVDFNGPVASVDARYTLTTSTLLSVHVNRDINFSFDETLPYYSLTDSGLQVTQRITTSWDVVASGAMQSLGYRGFTTEPTSKMRTDRGQIIGVGVGYLVGHTLRVGVNVNSYRRYSALNDRNYNGLRAGASVSYGIQ